MQYVFTALGLLSRLSLFVVVTPILAGWFFVWMVIATAFAWFAWLIVIIILSDVPMGEALWHWFVFWPMTITGWIIGASDWSNRTGIKLWGRKPGDSHGSARFELSRFTSISQSASLLIIKPMRLSANFVQCKLMLSSPFTFTNPILFLLTSI